MNPNDSIREAILKYFYNRNENATSEKGKKGSHVKIRDVKAELKALHGYTQPEVVSNLTYLIDSGWVEKVEESRSFRGAGGAQQPSTMTWYRITARGIDRVEGESSVFQRKEPYAGINIEAIASTVQVGDGNVVNARYADLRGELAELRDALAEGAELTDAQKLSAVSDIDTMQAQLAKPEPDRHLLSVAWEAVKGLALAAGLARNVAVVTDLLNREGSVVVGS